MPKLKLRQPAQTAWPLVLGAAVGQNSQDFFALGFSADYDDYQAKLYPPGDGYTHILHFKDLQQHRVCRIPNLLSGMWLSLSGKVLVVGNPDGIFEIDSATCNETEIKGLPGVLTAIWGVSNDHIFVCGVFDAFILYKRSNSWNLLQVPEGIGDALFDITGFNEQDVYFAGSHGTLLHYDGQAIQRLEVPTTENLSALLVFDEKNVCVGGNRGVFLFGNRKGWRYVPTGTHQPITSFALFNDQVCYPSEDGIWSFDGKSSPKLLVEHPAIWVNGLVDAISFTDYDNRNWIFNGKTVLELDAILSETVQ